MIILKQLLLNIPHQSMLNFVDKLQQFIKNSDNWHLAFSNHFTHKYKTLPRLYCIFWPMLIHLFFSSSFLSLSFSLFFSYISFFSSFFLHFQKGGVQPSNPSFSDPPPFSVWGTIYLITCAPE